MGLLFAVVFGALAYLYFEVSIALAMATVGFALGASVMAALGVEWSWLVVSVGVVVGALLAWLAIVADLPAVLLVGLTAFGGASVIVFGVMLLVDTVNTSDLESSQTTEHIADDWWWYADLLRHRHRRHGGAGPPPRQPAPVRPPAVGDEHEHRRHHRPAGAMKPPRAAAGRR